VSGGISGAGTGAYAYNGQSSYNFESNASSASGSQGLINVKRFSANGNDLAVWNLSVDNSGPSDTSTVNNRVAGSTTFFSVNSAYGYPDTLQLGSVSQISSTVVLTSVCALGVQKCPGKVGLISEPQTDA
jgi:hypothetical protein